MSRFQTFEAVKEVPKDRRGGPRREQNQAALSGRRGRKPAAPRALKEARASARKARSLPADLKKVEDAEIDKIISGSRKRSACSLPPTESFAEHGGISTSSACFDGVEVVAADHGIQFDGHPDQPRRWRCT